MSNPQAFPSPGVVKRYGTSDQLQGAYEGMSLRDYMAAKAMQAMNTNPGFDDKPFAVIAKLSYEQADAMLAERAK